MAEFYLHEGELYVMELLWSNKQLAAKDIAAVIKKYIGWEKNTTYTVIKRLIDKGAIKRQEPGFICSATVSKRTVQCNETKAFLNNFFDGSLNNFIIEYINEQKLNKSEIIELERIIDKYRNIV